jgi:2-hydroxychromene-2-carboxylate isomerase
MSAPVPTPVELWFDFISPYAYLAWQRIHPLVEAHGRSVVYRPTLFAGLLDHWGQLGPAEIPPKREWVFKQVLRRAHALGVPLQPPPRHPFNPLLGLRLASLELEPNRQRALIDALFRATWGGGPGIDDPSAVEAVLRAAGFDAESLLADATTPANKQRVIEGGREAISLGVFGVPTMIVDGELFWGDDSFAELDGFLRGEDPYDAELLRRWASLPVGQARSLATRNSP